MRFIHQMSVGGRVASGFALAITLLIALTGLSVVQGSRSSAAVRTLLDADFAASSRMQAIDGDVIRIHRAMKDVAL
ncbi:MAG TPA: hypothetical protein PKJ79_12025, partial [Quisquiliibacterium sp.]|nr:hypothetical protein [Quisquiliibacterium sp.]